MVTVIIPWRSQPTRIPAFEATTRWYRQNLPDAEILEVDSGDVPFNLARCRNLGIDRVDDLDEVVVIGDADTIPEREPLLAAIAAAATDGLVHLPYTTYQWLGPEGTDAFLGGTELADIPATLIRGACSGVYVTTPRTWLSHGGQDTRFRGWGFEDSAWFAAHTVLLGAEPARHEGTVWALSHDTQLREGEQYDANAALMARYRDAATPPEMHTLVFG